MSSGVGSAIHPSVLTIAVSLVLGVVTNPFRPRGPSGRDHGIQSIVVAQRESDGHLRENPWFSPKAEGFPESRPTGERSSRPLHTVFGVAGAEPHGATRWRGDPVRTL